MSPRNGNRGCALVPPASSSSTRRRQRHLLRKCLSTIPILFESFRKHVNNQVHINLLLLHLLSALLLLLPAFSWPGASDPAPYFCQPYPLLLFPLSPAPSPYRSIALYSLLLSPYLLYPATEAHHLIPYPLQCSTSYTVDPKPQALDPTP